MSIEQENEWIEWNGGPEAPVADDVRVEVRWIDPYAYEGVTDSSGLADEFFWHHGGSPEKPLAGDIIAYRIVRES